VSVQHSSTFKGHPSPSPNTTGCPLSQWIPRDLQPVHRGTVHLIIIM